MNPGVLAPEPVPDHHAGSSTVQFAQPSLLAFVPRDLARKTQLHGVGVVPSRPRLRKATLRMFDDCPPDDGAPLPDDDYAPALASCSGRSANRTAAVLAADPYIDWPVVFEKKTKEGVKVVVSRMHIENTRALLDAYGIKIRWNLMRHALEIDVPGFVVEPERAENANLAKIMEIADRRGLARLQVLDHLRIITQSYHPVLDWMRSKPWDGVDRLDAMLGTFGLADETDPYLAGLLIRRWLVSCAAAVLPPKKGERRFTPQGVIVLQGPQGSGKTEWFKSLAPRDSEWISVGRTVDPHSKDSVQQATAFWIVELGELDANYRKADIAALKAFVTQEMDVLRSAFERREERIPRRTVMGGSVNPRFYLVDETGNRRWWTVGIEKMIWQHGIDVQQLWAQMLTLAEAGEPWWLTAEDTVRLEKQNECHMLPDPLIEDLWAAWRPVPVQSTASASKVTLRDIWLEMCGAQVRKRLRTESNTLANALRAAGVENSTALHGERTYRVEKTSVATTQTPVPARNDGRYGKEG